MVGSALSVSGAHVERQRGSKFFAIAATLLLLVVLIAFSRTFYFRAFVDIDDLSTQLGEESLPLQLILHGLILTLWYAIFCIQAWLGARRDLILHRKLGVLGAGIAAAVVLSGAWTAVHYPARGIEAGGRTIEGMSGFVIGGLLGLVWFSIAVGLAIYLRRVPSMHKRLMYFASIGIIGPATAGGNRLFGAILDQWTTNWPLNNTMLVLLAAVAALIVYDLMTMRRVHFITVICAPAVILKQFLNQSLSASQAGQDFVNWLV